jgi:hypothetical protein
MVNNSINILTKQAIYSHLKPLNTKKPREMTLKFLFLDWSKHKNVAGLNCLMGSTPSDNWIANDNIDTHTQWKNLHRFASTQNDHTCTITKMYVNMDSTISVSVMARSNWTTRICWITQFISAWKQCSVRPYPQLFVGGSFRI